MYQKQCAVHGYNFPDDMAFINDDNNRREWMACFIEIVGNDLKFVPNMARSRLNELLMAKQKKGNDTLVRSKSHLDIEIQRDEKEKEEWIKKFYDGPIRAIY
jgi:hypothetical protein